jgi:signal transduction protein with GAF and PtsI domain
LDLVVSSAIDTMDGKAACLFLQDRQQEAFVPMAQKGLSEKYLHANPIKAKKVVEGLDETGYLSFPDAISDPRLENHEAKKEE